MAESAAASRSGALPRLAPEKWVEVLVMALKVLIGPATLLSKINPNWFFPVGILLSALVYGALFWGFYLALVELKARVVGKP